MKNNNPNGNAATPHLVFAGGFDERAADDAEARGYRAAVFVEFDDGRRYEVVFYDPVRLAQDLEDETAAGNPFISEPGLIVVPGVTLVNMQAAVAKLARERFFDVLVPQTSTSDVSAMKPTTAQPS